jgi:cell division protein FtsB
VNDTQKNSGDRSSFVEQLGEFFRRNVYWFLVAGFVLLLLQDVFGTHGVLAMRRSEKEAQEIQRNIKLLDQENEQLQEKVKALKTDPSAIEKIAREENRLARPGEYIFEVQPRSSDSSHPALQPPVNPPNKP